MTRTRSEYRRELELAAPPVWNRPGSHARQPAEGDAAALGALLLDAYRGTIDDEGEGDKEALDAATFFLGRCETGSSVVVTDADGGLITVSLVANVGSWNYVDPVVTAAQRKGQGWGRAAVGHAVDSLAADGVTEVRAVITDGNVPSEKLFASLGFVRVGPWG